MAFNRFTEDMDIISKLGDEPNEDDGLSADALKAKFDLAGKKIKTFLNNLITAMENATGAANIGFQSSTAVPKNNVQDAIENVQQQLVGISQDAVANNSITAEKMADGAVSTWTDVSNAITLSYSGSPSSAVESASVWSKEFKYNAVLGIVYYKIALNLKTSGAVEVIDFSHSGGYLPPYDPLVGHVASVFSDSCGMVQAQYGKQGASANAGSLEVSTGEAVNGRFYVFGWYFCNGEGS